MKIARWAVVITGCGFCINLITLVYLMVAWPEGSSFGIAEELLDAKAIGPPDSDARLDYIVRELQFRGQVDIHIMRVIVMTLMLDALLLGVLLWITIRSKRTVTSNVG